MTSAPPPLIVITSRQYERDAKRASKRGLDMGRLVPVVEELRHRRPLEPRHRDHALKGRWKGSRECHVEPDWLLIYQVDDHAGEVVLVRTGTHADLFRR